MTKQNKILVFGLLAVLVVAVFVYSRGGSSVGNEETDQVASVVVESEDSQEEITPEVEEDVVMAEEEPSSPESMAVEELDGIGGGYITDEFPAENESSGESMQSTHETSMSVPSGNENLDKAQEALAQITDEMTDEEVLAALADIMQQLALACQELEEDIKEFQQSEYMHQKMEEAKLEPVTWG